MKYNDLKKQATQGELTAENHIGAGWQLHATFPEGTKFNGMSIPLKAETKSMIYELAYPQTVCIGYESWVQFKDKDWESMQGANAILLAHRWNNFDKALDVIRLLLDSKEHEGCSNAQVGRAKLAELETVQDD